ncbi:transport protein [Thermoplasmatales archaeon]|nr:transport protein [Thermoplasmatales archaeon]
MFESSFRKLGIISKNNRKKIIILWVILFLVMLPFASLLFSETSYNLTNSIITKNSMSYEASSILDSQFPSSASGGSASSIIIVTNNTPVNNLKDSGNLRNLTDTLNSYFETVPGYTNTTSIYGLENTTLHETVPGLKAGLSGTASLINGTTEFYNNINSTMGFEYGLPALYLNTYAKILITENASYARNASYNTTINASKNISNIIPLAVLYTNTFSQYWNATESSNLTSTRISNMSLAINSTLNNGSFQYASRSIYPLMYEIRNFTSLHSYNSSPSSTTYNTSYLIINGSYSINATAYGFIASYLNASVSRFVQKSMNIGLNPTADSIKNLSVSFQVNATLNVFAHNPLVSVNPLSINSFVNFLYGTNASIATSQEMLDNDFSSFAILPSSYVYHQFVGYDNSTTILVVSFDQNTSASLITSIDNITSTYKSTIPNSVYLVAGSSALDNQLAGESLNGMAKALIIGIILSVVIIGLFFRSPIAAFIPLLIFGFSAVISMGINGLIYKYVLHTSISFITPTLLLILILGLTSDYIVYIMSRYRQELRKNSADPIPESAQWAGHAVFTSGLTVALSYIVLWIADVPIFSDSGLTNAIGVSVSIMLANTLLIALLATFGKKLFWPSKIAENKKFPFEHTMTKIAGGVIHNKKKLTVVFVLVTLLGLYVYSVTPSSMDVFSLVPSSSGIQALEQVNASFHGDFFDRGYVILNFSSPLIVNGQYNTTELNQVTGVEKALMTDNAISQVYGPTYPFGYNVNISAVANYPAQDSKLYYEYMNDSIGQNPHYAMITFQLAEVAWNTYSSNAVSNLPGVIDKATTDPSYTYVVGGLTQGLNDAYSYTAQTFSKLVPILAIAVFVVLMIQLSSLLTPIRLIIMVMASVVVSLAVTYIIYFNVLGLPILIFLPLFSFITLLAVGLDYDIFMITRAREAVIKGMSNEDAIRTSIIENGGVIITLGLLLFAIFFSLTFSGIGIIQEIGTGLALGVLIDTFISWPFFVPAIMLIMKKYNWWPSKMSKER